MYPEENDLTNEVNALINPDWMDEDEYQGVVGAELEDAVDFIDNTVSPIRAEATKYYRGEPFGDEEEGRSQVVSYDVRDTVQAILPSLMRIFTASDKAVEFMPRGPEDVEMAQQATDYVNYIFYRDNPGFMVLQNAFKDALVRKAGIVKFYWDESFETETSEMSGLDDAALATLSADPMIQIDMQRSYEAPEMLPPGAAEMGFPVPVMHDVRVTRRMPFGRVKIEALPPEEFLIDRRAKSIADADFVAHRRVVTVSDLVAMGYDFDEVSKLSTNTDDLDRNVERYTRNPALNDARGDRNDPAMRKVSYIECYIRVDRDGDGVAELRKVCVAGVGNKILSDEPCDVAPFAAFCPDPEPHDFFGMSIADSVMDIQRIKSVVMRNTLDSLAQSIHPRMAVVEGQANIEDVMNTETGAIVRMRSANAVQPLTMPFVGQQSFPVLEYMDAIKQQRTGISAASQGLDPDALTNATATGVNATVQAAQQHIEMIARLFAETGMRDLFRGVLRLVVQHQDQARMVRLTNEFVQLDPRGWNATMDVTVNVALGRGTDQARMAMLNQIGQMQREALSTLGPINPLTDLQKLYNTLSEMAALAGFKDTSKFWSDPAEFQPPPPQPPEPDVNQMLIQAQIMQIQADVQMKQAEIQRKREETEIDAALKVLELQAKQEMQVTAEQLKRSRELATQVMKAEADMVREAVRGEDQRAANSGRAGS
jgi:hypothetical protein